MHYVIAHYHELALKGRNRPFLVDRLVRNLREALRAVAHCSVEGLAGRIRISLDDPSQRSTIKTRLDAVFVLANFAPAVHVSSHLETMTKAICESVQSLPFHTFRVTTKRADKSYPLTSIEVNRHVGAAVVERTGAHVSLDNPEMTIYIEIMGVGAYYYHERFPGDRKSTRLNSSHGYISYAVFCLKKKKKSIYDNKPTVSSVEHLFDY